MREGKNKRGKEGERGSEAGWRRVSRKLLHTAIASTSLSRQLSPPSRFAATLLLFTCLLSSSLEAPLFPLKGCANDKSCLAGSVGKRLSGKAPRPEFISPVQWTEAHMLPNTLPGHRTASFLSRNGAQMQAPLLTRWTNTATHCWVAQGYCAKSRASCVPAIWFFQFCKLERLFKEPVAGGEGLQIFGRQFRLWW